MQYTFPADLPPLLTLAFLLKRTGPGFCPETGDIGAGRKIQAEKIEARSGLGLALYEDGGKGIFIQDGGERWHAVPQHR